MKRKERANERQGDVPADYPRLFPVTAVVGAGLAEQHDDWIQQKRYMSLTSLEQMKAMMASSVIDAEKATQEVA